MDKKATDSVAALLGACVSFVVLSHIIAEMQIYNIICV